MSGTSEIAFREADGEIPEAVPAGTIAALPAHFAPDVLVNQDFSSLPHNETSVAINPADPANIVVGANDYRLGFGTSGFYATTDGGRTWHDGVLPLPQVWFQPLGAAPTMGTTARTLVALDGGGDPAVAFDRAGTAYYAEIQFHRFGCVSMVTVHRSINKGLTWSRPLFGSPSPGYPVNDGDGIVVANDKDNDCRHFYDKEYIAVGPRPDGASLVVNTDAAHVTRDRIYVTFSDFNLVPPIGQSPYLGGLQSAGTVAIESPIMMSFSDDQGRHWSTPQQISGSSSTLCPGSPVPPGCVDDQGSSPVVDPRTGKIYVMFYNGDTGSNAVTQLLGGNGPFALVHGQVLVVSSRDGGQTWSSPLLVGSLTDNNLPAVDTTKCPGGAGNSLSNTCFRWSAFGTNITIDSSSGRLYVVWDDNRNGSSLASDVDVFLSTSTDGTTWSQPVRVNTDKLKNGKDQFFPWAAVDGKGTLFVSFLDRAGDPANHNIGTTICSSRDRGAHSACSALSTGLWNPDVAFRGGLFIGDYTGAAAGSIGAFAAWPDARRAFRSKIGDNPPPLFSDIVGGFSSGAGFTKVLGLRRGGTAASGKRGTLPATGVASRRVAAGVLILMAAATASAALGRARGVTT